MSLLWDSHLAHLVKFVNTSSLLCVENYFVLSGCHFSHLLQNQLLYYLGFPKLRLELPQESERQKTMQLLSEDQVGYAGALLLRLPLQKHWQQLQQQQQPPFQLHPNSLLWISTHENIYVLNTLKSTGQKGCIHLYLVMKE
jgi:hypothetical protein